MKQLKYKEYIGSVQFDDEEKLYYGKVLNTKGLISYEGNTYDELVDDFHEVIEEYLNSIQGGKQK